MPRPSFVTDDDKAIARVVGWDGEQPVVVYPGNAGGTHAHSGLPYEYVLRAGEWRPTTAADFTRSVRPSGSERMGDLRMWRSEFLRGAPLYTVGKARWERNPRTPTLYDDTYAGPRYTYGLSYRPLGFAQVPDGYIVFSNRLSGKFPFGTVDYPFELTPEQVDGFQLERIK